MKKILIGFCMSFNLIVFAMPAQSAEWILMSGMGAKCLDVEGGAIKQGARVIGYSCHGDTNQRFDVTNGGAIKIGGLCVDAAGGAGRDGDGLVLWSCHGGANQQWRYDNSRNSLVGIQGKCIDLEGGSGHWFGNQRAVLWSCHGQSNQKWYFSKAIPGSQVKGGSRISSGQLVTIKPPSGIVAGGAGNLIANDGASIVAGGAGNLIANDGASIVAGGAGNFIVPAGIVAGGAGN